MSSGRRLRPPRIGCLSSAPWNPYLRLLYAHLADQGIPSTPNARLELGWLWSNRKDVAVLHIHWPESLYRFGRGQRAIRTVLSWAKLGLLVFRLTCARILGYRILWTVHQLYPHELDGLLRERLATRALAR